MGAEAPYLYDAPSHRPVAYPYSDFNPRAATQASYEASIAASRPKQKQEGPLINFNRHPDSYMIVPAPQENHKELPKSTKKGIVATRWVQFGLRVAQLLGALGLLVCVICVKNTQVAEGWIIRVAPAWDCLITLYAVYHLLRPAKGRPALSSASYHFFALCMDVGLIPFYVFIALFANANWNETPGTKGRWTSFFSSNYSTGTILLATWLIATSVAALHLLSTGIDIYLAMMFRKIAHLPPDMNPLEENLTSRRSIKHKHKNSEMSASTLSMPDKHPNYLSGSTVSVGDSRLSTAKEPEVRAMPFGHSRTDSGEPFYSPHNPESARLSRQHLEENSLYQQSNNSRASHRHSRTGSTSPSKRDFYAESLAVPSAERLPSPRPASYLSARSQGPSRYSTPAPNAAIPAAEAKSQQKEGLLNDNWYVMNDSSEDIGSPNRSSPAPAYHDRDSSPKPQYNYAAPNSNRAMIPPRPLKASHDRHDSFEPPLPSPHRAPLGMNPPTPPSPQQEFKDAEDDGHTRYQLTDSAVGRTPTSASNISAAASSIYSESAPSLKSSAGTPKGRYYGDLAAATRGVRGSYVPPVPSKSPGPQPQRMSRSPSPQKQNGTRVISRTGADIADESVLFVPEHSPRRKGRRDVSGKIAEEGRGGWAMRQRQVSGVA